MRNKVDNDIDKRENRLRKGRNKRIDEGKRDRKKEKGTGKEKAKKIMELIKKQKKNKKQSNRTIHFFRLGLPNITRLKIYKIDFIVN